MKYNDDDPSTWPVHTGVLEYTWKLVDENGDHITSGSGTKRIVGDVKKDSVTIVKWAARLLAMIRPQNDRPAIQLYWGGDDE